MAKKIPITRLKQISLDFDYSQVIITAWNETTGTTTVCTYGKTQKDCEQAAIGGNFIKKSLGWPDSECNDAPYRAKQKNNFMQVNIIKEFITKSFNNTGFSTISKFELLKELNG